MSQADINEPSYAIIQRLKGVLNGQNPYPKASHLVKQFKQAAPQAWQKQRSASVYYLFEMVVRLGICFAALLYLAQQELTWGHYGLMAVLIVFQGINLFALTSLIHDCAHGALFQSSRVNRIVGAWLSPLILIRFDNFRTSHLQHHKYNQSHKDPKRKPVVKLGKKTIIGTLMTWVFERLYQRSPNVVKNVLIAVVMPFVVPLMILMTQEFGPFKAVTSKRQGYELSLLIAVWCVIIFYMPLLWWLGFVFLPVIISMIFTASVFMTHSGKYAIYPDDHCKQDYESMIFNITNITFGRIIDRLGFNFSDHHLEHHLFPALPFYRLAMAKQFIDNEYRHLCLPEQTMNFTFLREHIIHCMVDKRVIVVNGREINTNNYLADKLCVE